MRLLYVIPYYLPAIAFGGPVTVCAQLATAMVSRGHSVTVLTTDVASRTARVAPLREVIDGVRVLRVRNLSQRLVGQNLHTPIRSRQVLREVLHDVDVVHVHEFFSWLTLRAAQEARRFEKPILLSGHGSLSTAAERGRTVIKRVWLRALGQGVIQAAHLVQAATAYEAEQCVHAGVPRTKLRIVPQGVKAPPRTGDGQRFRRRFSLDQRPIFLFVGRLLQTKGVDLLREAALRLEHHPSRPVFVLVGPAENRPDLEPPGWREDNLLLTGALRGAELEDAYAAASAFVLPSFAEGMPVTALDALAFGLPCLLSGACNLPEVADAGAGLLCDHNLQSLEAGLRELLNRRSDWPAMSQAALQLAAQRFDLERVHSQYEQLYRELLNA